MYAVNGLYRPGHGAGDAFLARYSQSGSLIWGRQFGDGEETEEAHATCADGAGGAFVAGTFADGFGGWNEADAFIARFNGAGDELWMRRFGAALSDSVLGMCSDGAGGAYAAGSTRGSLAASNAGGSDCFVGRYSPAGVQLWIRQFGTGADEHACTAVPDGSGGVYIGGGTEGSLAPQLGAWDCWLARYNSAGDRLWIVQFGTASVDSLSSLCPDGSGGLYACGETYGSFGGPGAGNKDSFLAQIGSAGQVRWVRQLGTTGPDDARAVSADAAGAYIFGTTFGALAAPNLGSADLFLAHYSPSGQQAWVRQWGTGLTDYAHGSASDASGGVYVAGYRTLSNGARLATLARFPGPCFPNCDGSTSAPAVNVQDFTCFLQRYAAADAYANCDESTTAPVLNVQDFTCFLQRYAAGCP